MSIGELMCKIGMHRPLSKHVFSFVDVVSGSGVYKAECSCGKKWLVDSTLGWFGSKMERKS